MQNTITRPSSNIYIDFFAFAGICLLFAGFLFNRVVCNIGFLFVGVYTIYHIRSVGWLFKDRWMFTFILVALLPLASDIITDGIHFYQCKGIMKLLLILMPAFIFALRPDENMIQWFITGFIAMMLVSTGYGLFHYIANIETMASTYKVSKIMKVLALDDHIRISWATVISCIFAYYMLTIQKNSKIKWLLAIYIIGQVGFIHLIGSKTGLITLYFTAFIAGLYTFKNKLKWLAIFLLLLFVIPFTAYKMVPSVEQRFNFVKYDFEFYISGQYREGLSDAIRFYSLKGGCDIISDYPFIGTGFCRLQSEINEWYRIQMPEIKPYNYFLPSSEIVIYWASAGLVGLIVFLLHIFTPFFITYLKSNKWFIMYFIPAVFSFTYETHLEGQLPLFFYSFMTSWFWWMAYKYQKYDVK